MEKTYLEVSFACKETTAHLPSNLLFDKMYRQIIPVSYRGFFLPFLLSSASIPQLNSLIQVSSGLIQFLCKSKAVLVFGFVIQRRNELSCGRDADESQERQEETTIKTKVRTTLMICVCILLNNNYFVSFHPCS